MDNVNIVVSDDMPYGIKGHVNPNRDGSYTIFINAKYNIEQQQETLAHEMLHITNDDFNSDLSADELEKRIYTMLQGRPA